MHGVGATNNDDKIELTVHYLPPCCYPLPKSRYQTEVGSWERAVWEALEVLEAWVMEMEGVEVVF